MLGPLLEVVHKCCNLVILADEHTIKITPFLRAKDQTWKYKLQG